MERMMEHEEDVLHGDYGSMAFRSADCRSRWTCYDSSDYLFYGVVDDFGSLVAVSEYTNLRGY